MTQHKVYMNQIHCSSLLCELAQMWRSQALCDAIIKAGAITAKVHTCFLFVRASISLLGRGGGVVWTALSGCVA